MKRNIIVLLLLVFIAQIGFAAEKKAQPYSKDQVVLSLDGEPTIFDKNKEEQVKDTSDSLNLNYKYDYSKNEKNKLGYTSSIINQETINSETDTDSLSPEVKINDRLSVINSNVNDSETNDTKSEVIMTIKPFKDDRMDLDLGAGQSFSTDNQPAKSQLNLSTKFRF